jgi:hypothetical protein
LAKKVLPRSRTSSVLVFFRGFRGKGFAERRCSRCLAE